VLSDTLRSLGLIGGPLALLDSNAAVQLGIVYNYLPLMILPMYVALDRIDPALIRASMDLGAGPLRSFLSVTVPLAAPGIFGGVLLTFILAAGDYVVPAILGGAKGLMVGNLVATQILAAQNLPLGAGMAILLIFMLAMVVAAGAACCSRCVCIVAAPQRPGDLRGAGMEVGRFTLGRRLLLGWMALVFAFLFLPILVVVIYSFNGGRNLYVWTSSQPSGTANALAAAGAEHARGVAAAALIARSSPSRSAVPPASRWPAVRADGPARS
jgi:ABC-type spermidine/putrescine transport system permease subunit II